MLNINLINVLKVCICTILDGRNDIRDTRFPMHYGKIHNINFMFDSISIDSTRYGEAEYGTLLYKYPNIIADLTVRYNLLVIFDYPTFMSDCYEHGIIWESVKDKNCNTVYKATISDKKFKLYAIGERVAVVTNAKELVDKYKRVSDACIELGKFRIRSGDPIVMPVYNNSADCMHIGKESVNVYTGTIGTPGMFALTCKLAEAMIVYQLSANTGILYSRDDIGDVRTNGESTWTGNGIVIANNIFFKVNPQLTYDMLANFYSKGTGIAKNKNTVSVVSTGCVEQYIHLTYTNEGISAQMLPNRSSTGLCIPVYKKSNDICSGWRKHVLTEDSMKAIENACNSIEAGLFDKLDEVLRSSNI